MCPKLSNEILGSPNSDLLEKINVAIASGNTSFYPQWRKPLDEIPEKFRQQLLNVSNHSGYAQDLVKKKNIKI